MNTPKISLKIIRHEYVKNLLGDSYDEHSNPFPKVVNVGTYTLAHVEGMQEFLKQEEDVTSYNNNMSDLDMELPDFMFNTGVKFDL
jgi:hypothetical protein